MVRKDCALTTPNHISAHLARYPLAGGIRIRTDGKSRIADTSRGRQSEQAGLQWSGAALVLNGLESNNHPGARRPSSDVHDMTDNSRPFSDSLPKWQRHFLHHPALQLLFGFVFFAVEARTEHHRYDSPDRDLCCCNH